MKTAWLAATDASGGPTILGGISADPELLRLGRISFTETGGPQRAHEKLAAILADEQVNGRLKPDADPQALAFLLIGSCTEYATLARVLGTSPRGMTAEEHAANVWFGFESGHSVVAQVH